MFKDENISSSSEKYLLPQIFLSPLASTFVMYLDLQYTHIIVVYMLTSRYLTLPFSPAV